MPSGPAIWSSGAWPVIRSRMALKHLRGLLPGLPDADRDDGASGTCSNRGSIAGVEPERREEIGVAARHPARRAKPWSLLLAPLHVDRRRCCPRHRCKANCSAKASLMAAESMATMRSPGWRPAAAAGESADHDFDGGFRDHHVADADPGGAFAGGRVDPRRDGGFDQRVVPLDDDAQGAAGKLAGALARRRWTT